MKSIVILYFIKIYVNHINSLIELNEMEFQIIFYENFIEITFETNMKKFCNSSQVKPDLRSPAFFNRLDLKIVLKKVGERAFSEHNIFI